MGECHRVKWPSFAGGDLRSGRILGAIAALIGLAACTVRLVTPYDPVIDDGLVSFNRAFLAFMAEIREELPGPQGRYAGNTAFYHAQQANLGTLVQRAEASDPRGSCPGTALTEQAVRKIDAIVLPQQAAAGPEAPDTTPPRGSCMTVLLTNIQDQLTDTGCFHRAIYGETSAGCEARGFTPPVARSLGQAPVSTKQTLLGQVQVAVTTSVTAAMTLELAKKQGNDGGD